MKCDPKTMLRIGVIITVLLVAGFVTFPQFRQMIIGLAPFALLALCPLSMIFMMGSMNKEKSGHGGCASCDDKKVDTNVDKSP